MCVIVCVRLALLGLTTSANFFDPTTNPEYLHYLTKLFASNVLHYIYFTYQIVQPIKTRRQASIFLSTILYFFSTDNWITSEMPNKQSSVANCRKFVSILWHFYCNFVSSRWQRSVGWHKIVKDSAIYTNGEKINRTIQKRRTHKTWKNKH